MTDLDAICEAPVPRPDHLARRFGPLGKASNVDPLPEARIVE